MFSKNKCIVLSKLKFGESDLIVKCYTSERGIVSYILKGVFKSKKGAAKIVYFQPLSLLEVVERFNPKQSLHYLKEIKPYHIFKSLHSNIYKSAIVLFLTDVMAASITEEEKNAELYTFLETSLQYLDEESSFANFHLLFLLKLTQYLGFKPQKYHETYSSFNLRSGVFENAEDGIYSVSGKNMILLERLLGINFDGLTDIKMNSEERRSFLNMLLFYFELHLDGFKKPKSLEVLNDVFH